MDHDQCAFRNLIFRSSSIVRIVVSSRLVEFRVWVEFLILGVGIGLGIGLGKKVRRIAKVDMSAICME